MKLTIDSKNTAKKGSGLMLLSGKSFLNAFYQLIKGDLKVARTLFRDFFHRHK